MDNCYKYIKACFVILICFTSSTTGRSLRSKKGSRRDLQIEDCGYGDNQMIQVLGLTVKPSVVRIPGKVRIWPSLNITDELPTLMAAVVSVQKLEERGRKVTVLPETYYHDVCNLLNADYDRNGCQKAMNLAGVPCVCPFPKGLANFKIEDKGLQYFLPELYVNWDIEGRYEMTVSIHDAHNHSLLGCAKLKFFIKRRRRETIASAYSKLLA